MRYYVSPDGTGKGTYFRPMRLRDACHKLSSGDSLRLKTCPWQVTRFTDPINLSGLRNIDIRATGWGIAVLDGQEVNVPFSAQACTNLRVDRIFAHNSARHVFSLNRCANVTLLRCAGWDAGPGNARIFQLNRCENVLEDRCFGWGRARKIFEPYKSKGVLSRGCYAQGGGYDPAGWATSNDDTPTMAFSLCYQSKHITADGCVATWDQTAPPEGHAYGLFAVDRNDPDKGYTLDADILLKNSLAFTLLKQKVRPSMLGGVFVTGLNDVTITGVDSIMPHGHRPFLLSDNGKGGQQCMIHNCYGAIRLPCVYPNWTREAPRDTPNPRLRMDWSMTFWVKKVGGPDVRAQLKALRKAL